MIIALISHFFSFSSLFIESWPILEIFFNLNFHRDLFQSHKFLYAQHRMATSELRSWSLISTHFSLSLMQYECLFNMYSQQHILMASYHNYTTLSGFHNLTYIHHIHLLSHYYFYHACTNITIKYS